MTSALYQGPLTTQKSRKKGGQWVEGKVGVWTFYPLQKPLGPAAQAVDSDPHLGERSDVQDLHEEGVILLPLKSGGGENGHEEGKPATWRGSAHARNQIHGKENTSFYSASLSVPSDSPLACVLHRRCVPTILGEVGLTGRSGPESRPTLILLAT